MKSDDPSALQAEVDRLEARVKELEQALVEARRPAKSTLGEADPAFEASLANLYCASYQLHATLETREVVQVALEILLNFLGAKTAAIFVRSREDDCFKAVTVTGLDPDYVPRPVLGKGRIGESCKRGNAVYDEHAAERGLDVDRPAVCVPLRFEGEIVGAVVVWTFLRQKPNILDYDRELFDLLAAHLAPALVASVLFRRAGVRTLDYADLRELVS